jgi:hypothetical protein
VRCRLAGNGCSSILAIAQLLGSFLRRMLFTCSPPVCSSPLGQAQVMSALFVATVSCAWRSSSSQCLMDVNTPKSFASRGVSPLTMLSMASSDVPSRAAILFRRRVRKCIPSRLGVPAYRGHTGSFRNRSAAGPSHITLACPARGCPRAAPFGRSPSQSSRSSAHSTRAPCGPG